MSSQLCIVICFFFAIETINFLAFSLRFPFPKNSRNVVIGMKKAPHLIPSEGEDRKAKEKELSQTPIKSLKFLQTFSFSFLFFYVLVLYYNNWNIVDPGWGTRFLNVAYHVLRLRKMYFLSYIMVKEQIIRFLNLMKVEKNVFLPSFYFWFSCLDVFSSSIQIIILPQ